MLIFDTSGSRYRVTSSDERFHQAGVVYSLHYCLYKNQDGRQYSYNNSNAFVVNLI